MKTIIRIIKYAKPWRTAIIFSTIALLLMSGLQLLLPMVARELLARIAADNLSIKIVVWLTVALAGVYIMRIIFQFTHDYLSHFAGNNLVNTMRHKLYNHIQQFSPKWFLDKSTGQVVARVNTDTMRLENLVAHSLPDLISSALIFFGAIGMLLYINPLLTAFLCIPIPLILITSIFARRIRKLYVTAKNIEAHMLGDVTDNIQGIKEIQVFNRQDYESQKIATGYNKLRNAWLKAAFWRALVNPLVFLMHGMGHITIILAGGLLAYHGHTSAADITAFILYIGMVYMPIGNLARIIEDMQDSLTSGKRIFEIMDTPTEIADSPTAIAVGVLKGDIEFSNVSFDYQGIKEVQQESGLTTEEPVTHILNNISFTAPANKTLALVGPTGAGKTTITSLLTRFFDVNRGGITIDGTDIRDMTLKSLRDNISMVLQDVYLFNGTIGDNIGYGKEGAIQDEIIDAAKKAAIHDFIMTLPEGYDTVVGERGTRLSGGQKQRVALARAILRGSSILILDEATSAVDNETERNIQAAINKISGSRTMIVIAHRLSTIMHADQILYLENGMIKERGTYKQLIDKKGAFAKLAKGGIQG